MKKMNINNYRAAVVPALFFSWLLSVACNDGHEQKAGEAHEGHAMQEMAPASIDYAQRVNEGVIKEDTMKGSPHRTAMANIGDLHVHIEYGSPGVKGRIIWGGLVPYDKVWSTGAHQATKVSFSRDVIIAGKVIPAGDYGFFTIPGKDKWTLILNKNYDQHLSDEYNAAEDVVRVEVTPGKPEKIIQRLTYKVKKLSPTAGEITVQWENVSVSLPLTIQ